MALTYPYTLVNGIIAEGDEVQAMFDAIQTKFAGNIGPEDLAALCATAAKIAASAVTTTKIADDAVTQDKVADNAIGGAQIAAGAIGAAGKDHIANDAVSWDDHADDARNFYSFTYTGDGLGQRDVAASLPWVPTLVMIMREHAANHYLWYRTADMDNSALVTGALMGDDIAAFADFPATKVRVSTDLNADTLTHIIFAWKSN